MRAGMRTHDYLNTFLLLILRQKQHYIRLQSLLQGMRMQSRQKAGTWCSVLRILGGPRHLQTATWKLLWQLYRRQAHPCCPGPVSIPLCLSFLLCSSLFLIVSLCCALPHDLMALTGFGC